MGPEDVQGGDQGQIHPHGPQLPGADLCRLLQQRRGPGNLPPEERAADLLGRMTLREKVGQLTQRLYGFACYERTPMARSCRAQTFAASSSSAGDQVDAEARFTGSRQPSQAY